MAGDGKKVSLILRNLQQIHNMFYGVLGKEKIKFLSGTVGIMIYLLKVKNIAASTAGNRNCIRGRHFFCFPDVQFQ